MSNHGKKCPKFRSGGDSPLPGESSFDTRVASSPKGTLAPPLQRHWPKEVQVKVQRKAGKRVAPTTLKQKARPR